MKKVKISHLFHWLYAILMLMPAFAIGVTCAYAIFNKNAYQSYAGVNENDYKYVDVNSLNDLQVGKEYVFLGENLSLNQVNTNNTYIYTQELTYNDIKYENGYFNFYSTNNNNDYIYIYDASNTQISSGRVYRYTFTFIYLNTTFSNSDFEYIKQCIKEIQYFEMNYLSEVFYYSIDRVQQSPLFSWSFDSFLAQPFEFITDVFSIPHGNIIVFFASYWLAMSIIWLCFDLVMYVPNLVHKWLDKGSIS